MLQPKLAKDIAKVFQEKTGAEWGQLKPGDDALPGKYWLQQQANPDLSAKWEYYVDNGVDGKRTGWYPYTESASAEVEEIYAQHVANARESRTSTRTVCSGYFSYEVDLNEMKQRNTRTRKVRAIRRASGNEEGSIATPVGRIGRVMKRAMKRAAMKRKREASTGSMKKKPEGAMRSMKVMKKKKSTIGSKSQVLKGKRIKTKGGMKAADLMKNKKGKVVSKRRHAVGKAAYAKNLAAWVNAFSQARKELGLTGFVAIKKGTEFYSRAKALMSS
jgi:hypothetical protein